MGSKFSLNTCTSIIMHVNLGHVYEEYFLVQGAVRKCIRVQENSRCLLFNVVAFLLSLIY